MAKKFIINLSPTNINKAIEEIRKEYTNNKQLEISKNIINKLRTKGVEIIQTEITTSLLNRGSRDNVEFTGALINSVKAIGSKDNTQLILRVTSPYGAYVEFGTGIVGEENAATAPHSTIHGWKHNVNKLKQGDGWYYYDEREARWRWTEGQEGTAFMLHSAVMIKDEIKKIFKQYKGDNIK